MDYQKLLVQELNSIAKHWVEQHDYDYKGGVVLIFEGRVNGWVKEPPIPSDWRPGVYAVSKDHILMAVGGNNVDGAEKWIPV
ncbi:MAG: hypothetical protein IBX55_09930 [Methyloprofundus sp.]|nr:hypothetical protein [Methyloprofundus sp.]